MKSGREGAAKRARMSVICPPKTAAEEKDLKTEEVTENGTIDEERVCKAREEASKAYMALSYEPRREDAVAECRRGEVECPVCGEVTMDVVHYGGLACTSCRAFFRRTVVVHRGPRRPCRWQGSCHLRRQRRNNCPACR